MTLASSFLRPGLSYDYDSVAHSVCISCVTLIYSASEDLDSGDRPFVETLIDVTVLVRVAIHLQLRGTTSQNSINKCNSLFIQYDTPSWGVHETF